MQQGRRQTAQLMNQSSEGLVRRSGLVLNKGEACQALMRGRSFPCGKGAIWMPLQSSCLPLNGVFHDKKRRARRQA